MQEILSGFQPEQSTPTYSPLESAFIRLLFTDGDFYLARQSSEAGLAKLYSTRAADIQRLQAALTDLQANGQLEGIDINNVVEHMGSRDAYKDSLNQYKGRLRRIFSVLGSLPARIQDYKDHESPMPFGPINEIGARYILADGLAASDPETLQQKLLEIIAKFDR